MKINIIYYIRVPKMKLFHLSPQLLVFDLDSHASFTVTKGTHDKTPPLRRRT